MSSIFSKIINHEIPCTKVYEDEKCFAFLDINPVTKGHTLLVPKQEIERMHQVPNELLSHMFLVTKQLMQQMITHLWVDYVQISVEGIEVPHFHIHLIPNMKENHVVTRQHVEYSEGEAGEVAKKIIGDL